MIQNNGSYDQEYQSELNSQQGYKQDATPYTGSDINAHAERINQHLQLEQDCELLKTIIRYNSQATPELLELFKDRLRNPERLKQFMQLTKMPRLDTERVPLQNQLDFLMTKLTPNVKNKSQVIKEIMSTQTFNKVHQIKSLNEEQKDNFIKFVRVLQSWKEASMYGIGYNIIKQKFNSKISKQLEKLDQNDKDPQIKRTLMQDPMHDFSASQELTIGTKKFIYTIIYNMAQFKEYSGIKHRPNSLKYKQCQDIRQIINFINEFMSPEDFSSFKKQLEEYKYQHFFEDQKFGGKKLRQVYQFVRNCPNYWNYYYQVFKKDNKKEASNQNRENQLRISLRQYLYQLRVPFQIHGRLQQIVFNEKKFQVLSQALTNDQKKKLLTQWVFKNMIDFYKSQFHFMQLREQAKIQIMDSLIIDLKITSPYHKYVQFTQKILNKKSDQVIPKDQFAEGDIKKIRQNIKKWKYFKQYCVNNGVDYNLDKYNSQNILFYQIMIPKQFGNLHEKTIKQFILKYVEQPIPQQILSSEIQNKKQLMRMVKQHQKLKIINKSMKNYIFSTKKQKLKGYLKKYITLQCGSQLIYSLYEKYGKLYFNQKQLIIPEGCEDQEYNQLAETLKSNPNGYQEILNCQESNQFIQFLHGYPETIQASKKQCQQQLIDKIRSNIFDNIANMSEERLETLLKNLSNSNFQITEGMAPKVKTFINGLPQFQKLQRVKETLCEKQSLINQIKFEKNIKQILDRESFNKYSNQEKREILKILRNDDKSSAWNMVSDILTKKDYDELVDLTKDIDEPLGDIITTPKKLNIKIEDNKSSSNKNIPPTPVAQEKNSKVLTSQQWKAQLQKTYNQTYQSLVESVKLIAKTQQQLKNYQNKLQILNQYQGKLSLKKSQAQTTISSILQKNKESIIVPFLRQNKPLIEILSDLQWGEAAFSDTIKNNYQIKLQAKFNKMLAELKTQEIVPILNKYRSIINETDALAKMKAV